MNENETDAKEGKITDVPQRSGYVVVSKNILSSIWYKCYTHSFNYVYTLKMGI